MTTYSTVLIAPRFPFIYLISFAAPHLQCFHCQQVVLSNETKYSDMMKEIAQLPLCPPFCNSSYYFQTLVFPISIMGLLRGADGESKTETKYCCSGYPRQHGRNTNPFRYFADIVYVILFASLGCFQLNYRSHKEKEHFESCKGELWACF